MKHDFRRALSALLAALLTAGLLAGCAEDKSGGDETAARSA